MIPGFGAASIRIPVSAGQLLYKRDLIDQVD